MATATVTKVIEIDVRQSASAQAHVKQMADSMKNLDDTTAKAAKSTKGSLDFITSGLKSMAAGFVVGAITTGVLSAVASFRDMADGAQVLRARLAQVTGGVEEASKAFLRITQISVTHGQSMDAIGTLYEKIARNSENLGVTQLGVAAITNSFAASLRLSGAGAQQAEAAILQFSQALASGRLAGDEYRSMTENNAVFMQELGRASGKTMGELKKMSSEGKIDLEFLRNAMLTAGTDGKTMLDKLDEGAAKLPMTFKQAREQVATQLTNLVDALVNTANNSESIFTSMAKRVASVFGAMAAEFRIFTEGKAAEAAFRAGKSAPEAEMSIETQAIRKQIDVLANLRDDIAKRREGLGKMQPTGMAALDAESGVRRREMEKELGALEARANGMASAIGKVNASIAELSTKPSLAQLISGNPTKAPAKPDKKKGGGGSKLEDPLIEFQKSLMLKDINTDNKLDGMGPNEIALEKALAKTTLKGEQLRNVLAEVRDRAQEMDRALKLSNYGKDVEENMTKAYDAQRKADGKMVEDLVSEGQKRFVKTDPLLAFVAKVQELNNAIELIESKTIFGSEDQLAALKEYRENLNLTTEKMGEFGEKGKSVAEEIADAMRNSTKEMADAIIDFATGAEASFSKMLLNIVKNIASAQLQRALSPFMKESGDWLTKMFGGQVGSSKSYANATGGAFDIKTGGMGDGLNALGGVYGNTGWGRVQAFAKGGVFDSPTGFGHSGGLGVLGEAGPEAIMPLARDGNGKLGVATAPVSIEIINMSGGEVEQNEGTDENGNKKIMIMIHRAVNEGIQGGKFDKSMSNTYGVKRKGQ